MTQPVTFPADGAIIAAPLDPSSAGVRPTMISLLVDPQLLATGYRVSDLVGRTVINVAGETVAKVDDLIVGSNEAVPFAVLSVGGVLGMGVKHVVVAYSALEVNDRRMLFRGATKEALMSLPDLMLGTGERTSNVVGATVVNGDDETVGTVDDLFITANENIHFAVLSVGGFLGLGAKRVVVPYRALERQDKAVLFLDATRECLKSLPEFNYCN